MDLISRQAIMKEFTDFVRRANNSDFAQTPTWNDAVSLVGSMPSAQQWIPVSERLPEPSTAVLAYAPKYGNIWELYYDTINGWMVWSPIADDFFPYSQGDVIAWMPLPPAFKEEE